MVLRRTTYFLATLLCLTSCTATLPLPTPPQQQNLIPEIFDPFVATNNENDPYPFVGSIHREDGSLIGGGVLIAPDVVLTAGHCIDNKKIDSVYFGEMCVPVSSTLLHPEYEMYGRPVNDIGIIFLEYPVDINPISLHNNRVLWRFSDITVIGYSFGYKKYSKPSVFQYYGTILEDINEIKFLPRRATIWFGDSGGAVIATLEGEERLVGIITSFLTDEFGIVECSATRIKFYRGWIEEVLNEQGLDGRGSRMGEQ